VKKMKCYLCGKPLKVKDAVEIPIHRNFYSPFESAHKRCAKKEGFD